MRKTCRLTRARSICPPRPQVDEKGDWNAVGIALRAGQGAGTRVREMYTIYLQGFVNAVEQGCKIEAADEDMEQFVQVRNSLKP